MLITAFVLSLVFIAIGAVGLNSSNNWDAVVWIVMTIYPGVVGFGLALLSLGIKFIPVVKVASPYLAWISCIATLSMILYAVGGMLLSLVWK